jgi:hypothetical protein
MREALAAALLAAALLAGAPAAAAPLAVGDAAPALALEDQHGRRGAVGPDVRVVVVSRDMEAGDVVRKALAGRDQGFLDAHRIVYVANVSGMPALVTRLFALPRMRERPYRMLLDRDGQATRDVPAVVGRPTVLTLAGGRIARITHPGDPGALAAEIAPPAP